MLKVFECMNCRATMAGIGEPSQCVKCHACKLYLKQIHPAKG